MDGFRVGSAFSFLIEAVFHLFMVALLLRILLEALAADYYNPISQILLRVTDPLVRPLRGLLPNVGRISLAGIVLLLVLQVTLLLILLALSGSSLDAGTLLALAVLRLVRMLLVLYLVLIIIGVILSWVGGHMRHPIIPVIWQLTEPVLRPIRQVLPGLGGLDLSPLVALIAINFLLILLPAGY